MFKRTLFPVAVLKPAAWLLFGAAAIFGSTAAQAITFPWAMSLNFSGTNITGSGSLEATLLSGTTYQLTSISGTWNGETILGLIGANGTALDYNISNVRQPQPDNQFDTQGVLNFRPVSRNGYAFWTTGRNAIVMYLDNTVWTALSCPGCVNGSSNSSSFPTINSATVPAPLPILGLPAVLFYSRRIKKRLKQRSLAPVSG